MVYGVTVMLYVSCHVFCHVKGQVMACMFCFAAARQVEVHDCLVFLAASGQVVCLCDYSLQVTVCPEVCV